MSFDDWMKNVDSILSQTVGIESSDLPDCRYAEWHEDGVSPKRAAAKAIKHAHEF